MSALCRYKILPEFKLVIGKYSGQISENDIISLKGEIKNDKDFNWDFNVLDDYSDTVFNLSEKGSEIIGHWLRENYTSSRQSALLTDTPGQVVVITLFKDLDKNELPMNIRIFSALSSALPWIGISSKHENEIAEILKDL